MPLQCARPEMVKITIMAIKLSLLLATPISRDYACIGLTNLYWSLQWLRFMGNQEIFLAHNSHSNVRCPGRLRRNPTTFGKQLTELRKTTGYTH